jgi:hypothetical protein
MRRFTPLGGMGRSLSRHGVILRSISPCDRAASSEVAKGRLRSPTPHPPDHPGPPGRSDPPGPSSPPSVSFSANGHATALARLRTAFSLSPLSEARSRRCGAGGGVDCVLSARRPLGLRPRAKDRFGASTLPRGDLQRRQSKYPLARPSLIGVNKVSATVVNGSTLARRSDGESDRGFSRWRWERL